MQRHHKARGKRRRRRRDLLLRSRRLLRPGGEAFLARLPLKTLPGGVLSALPACGTSPEGGGQEPPLKISTFQKYSSALRGETQAWPGTPPPGGVFYLKEKPASCASSSAAAFHCRARESVPVSILCGQMACQNVPDSQNSHYHCFVVFAGLQIMPKK